MGYILEKAAADQETALAKSDEAAAATAASQEQGYIKAADTVAETSSFSDGTSMMSAVQEANGAEKDALKTMSATAPKPSEALASATQMAAKIEALNVKVKAAAEDASAAAASEEELGSDEDGDDQE